MVNWRKFIPGISVPDNCSQEDEAVARAANFARRHLVKLDLDREQAHRHTFLLRINAGLFPVRIELEEGTLDLCLDGGRIAFRISGGAFLEQTIPQALVNTPAASSGVDRSEQVATTIKSGHTTTRKTGTELGSGGAKANIYRSKLGNDSHERAQQAAETFQTTRKPFSAAVNSDGTLEFYFDVRERDYQNHTIQLWDGDLVVVECPDGIGRVALEVRMLVRKHNIKPIEGTGLFDCDALPNNPKRIIQSLARQLVQEEWLLAIYPWDAEDDDHAGSSVGQPPPPSAVVLERIKAVQLSPHDNFPTLIDRAGIDRAKGLVEEYLSGIDASETDLLEFNFSGAVLTNAILTNARVRAESLRDTDLRGADLRGTGLDKFTLSAVGSKIDDTTRLGDLSGNDQAISHMTSHQSAELVSSKFSDYVREEFGDEVPTDQIMNVFRTWMRADPSHLDQDVTTEVPAEEPISTALAMDELRIELGYGLLSLINDTYGHRLTDQIKALRRQFAGDMGFVMPSVRILDNMQLPANEYVIRVKEIESGRGTLRPDKLLIVGSRENKIDLPGERTIEPAFGLPAIWVDSELREEASFRGYTVADPSTVVTTHFTEVVRENMADLLSYSATLSLLEGLPQKYERLIEEIIPSEISTTALQRVLQRLLAEHVSIRDLPTLLDGVAEAVGHTHNVVKITEHVRTRFSRQISYAATSQHGYIPLVELSQEWEMRFAEAFVRQDDEEQLAMAPGQVEEFLGCFRSVFDELSIQGERPVLVTSPKVRPYVYSLVERIQRKTMVISLNEIHPSSQVKKLQAI